MSYNNVIDMEKTAYVKPTVKVVAFQVENGFSGSDTRLGETLLGRKSNYSTGESFTEHTDDSGEFDFGRWQ